MSVARLLLTTVIVFLLTLGSYLLGAYSYPRNIWPIELLRDLKRLSPYTVGSGSYPAYNRYFDVSSKKVVPCPPNSLDTGVLLIIGQSNSANTAAKKYTTEYSGKVVNYFEGRCFDASSPLLGATGQGGEFLTPLADNLVRSGIYKNVVIITSSINSSLIARWERDGDLNKMLIKTLREAAFYYPMITDVIYHQGEADYNHTTRDAYTASFRSLVASLLEIKVTAPIFISVATRCAQQDWESDNSIAIAQRSLVDNKHIFLGLDSDDIIELGDRFDGCHFNETGQMKAVLALTQAIGFVKQVRDIKEKGN